MYKNRSRGLGGGLGFFVGENIHYVVRDDLCNFAPSYESLAIEIFGPNSLNLLIHLIYRPPNSDPHTFLTEFSAGLDLIKQKTKRLKSYIMGDFNINLLNQDVYNISNQFSNLLYSYNYIPLISSPTRVTETTSSLIDNIFTNNICDHSSGIIDTDLSDHYPIFTSIPCQHINRAISPCIKRNNFSPQSS